jgi:hypothetical protein
MGMVLKRQESDEPQKVFGGEIDGRMHDDLRCGS